MENLTSDIDSAAVAVENALPGLGQDGISAQRRSDSLAHADAKNRNLAAEVFDSSITDTRVSFWVSRPWADHQLGRILSDQLLERNLVIAVHGDGCAFKDQVLVDIPGERVIVIDQNDVRSGWNGQRWIGMARRVVCKLESGHVENVPITQAEYAA